MNENMMPNGATAKPDPGEEPKISEVLLKVDAALCNIDSRVNGIGLILCGCEMKPMEEGASNCIEQLVTDNFQKAEEILHKLEVICRRL